MQKSTNQKFVVEGGKALKGTVKVSGSKNAALPILCAALLAKTPSTLNNVPDIADIHSLIEIFTHLGVTTTFKDNTLTVDPSGLTTQNIPEKLICSMRASILLLGPLVSRFGEAKLPFPGGCVLGKRPVLAHTHAFKALGAQVLEDETSLHIKTTAPLKAAKIIMPELSVTATENALMAATTAQGTTQIRLAAAEPHVQDLCHFLNTMGAKITGIGTHFLTVEGVKPEQLNGTEYTVTGDYLEAGTFAIAGLITKGEVTITGIDVNHLDSFWEKLEEAGANYTLKGNEITVYPTEKFNAIQSLRTAVYPSFPTDLQAPFSVLLTQADGESRIFETLFEGRLQYLYELEKMGAKVEVQNPHQAKITGPAKLSAAPIASLDIRAGTAMVLAALCAQGSTEISNINYIDRGYENLEGKLTALGASIKRIETTE